MTTETIKETVEKFNKYCYRHGKTLSQNERNLLVKLLKSDTDNEELAYKDAFECYFEYKPKDELDKNQRNRLTRVVYDLNTKMKVVLGTRPIQSSRLIGGYCLTKEAIKALTDLIKEGSDESEEKRNSGIFQPSNKYKIIIKEHFGRKVEIGKIREVLSKKGLCIISGKPGFGKSSIALKCCDEASKKHKYTNILFLNCETMEETKKSINLTDVKNKEIDDALDKYFEGICSRTSEKWLLVFDNLGKDHYYNNTEDESISPDYLRNTLVGIIKKLNAVPNIDILVTTIYENLFYETEYNNCKYEICDFSRDEAKAYLKKDIPVGCKEDDIEIILNSFTHIPIVLKTVKNLARIDGSYKGITPDYVHGNDEMSYLLSRMLGNSGTIYTASLQVASYFYKDSIPLDFLAKCVKQKLDSPYSVTEIRDEIRRKNQDYHIFDISQEDEQYYCSIHQVYQIEIRKIWGSERNCILEEIFNTFSTTQNFFSYYGKLDFDSVRELKPHIESFWNYLEAPTKDKCKELWIHYRWIDEYFLSSGNEYITSPFPDNRDYSLRFESDRLINCLEDGNFERSELSDFINYLEEPDSKEVINSSLLVRCRICVFFLELITVNEASCVMDSYEGCLLSDYVAETLEMVKRKVDDEKDIHRRIFYFEHTCMFCSMLSIVLRKRHSQEGSRTAVNLNIGVIELIDKLSSGKHPKLPVFYDSSYLRYFALNLSAVPQWEEPEYFLDNSFCGFDDSISVVSVLEKAYLSTKECYEYYLGIGYFERIETELGNLFDICGLLADNHNKAGNSQECISYIEQAEHFLNERYNARANTNYLSPEFMFSYFYKKFTFYSQYLLSNPNFSPDNKKDFLLNDAQKVLLEWETFVDKVSNNNRALFFRKKGVFYRKLLDTGCYINSDEKSNYFNVAMRSFEEAVQCIPDDNSIKIINNIEMAYTHHSFGHSEEGKRVLERIEKFVHSTGEWKTAYTKAKTRSTLW